MVKSLSLFLIHNAYIQLQDLFHVFVGGNVASCYIWEVEGSAKMYHFLAAVLSSHDWQLDGCTEWWICWLDLVTIFGITGRKFEGQVGESDACLRRVFRLAKGVVEISYFLYKACCNIGASKILIHLSILCIVYWAKKLNRPSTKWSSQPRRFHTSSAPPSADH